tara:strand:+ start:1003 stop:1905 length:903 start_codon:yes stop_codon:yes gene_type:complete
MTQPKVTVLMSVLNGEDYLREAIDSILAQTFTDFEFLIIDNASTDGTATIIASYDDARIRCIRNDDVLTLTQSLNKGLEAARGEYIARLDADDIAFANRLDKQVRHLDDHPDVALVASVATDFGNGAPLPGVPGPTPPNNHDDLLVALARDSIIAHSSIMFRRQDVMKIGGYPGEYAYCMDYLLYFRLARHHRLGCLPEPLVAIRSHPSQITSLPAWGLRRETEAAAAFQEILTYPDMPAAVRRGLLRYRALTSLRLAALYARAHAPMQACAWIIRAFVQAPCTFSRLVWTIAAKRAGQS